MFEEASKVDNMSVGKRPGWMRMDGWMIRNDADDVVLTMVARPGLCL